jgi:hypothetical protein
MLDNSAIDTTFREENGLAAILAGVLYVVFIVAFCISPYGPRSAIGILLMGIVTAMALGGIAAGWRWGRHLDLQFNGILLLHKHVRLNATEENVAAAETALHPSWAREVVQTLRASASTDVKATYYTAARRIEAQSRAAGLSVRYLAGAVMLVGLLGTFLGMIASVRAYQAALTNLHSATDTPTAKPTAPPRAGVSIARVVGGLDRAFATTVCGIVASLLLASINVYYRARERDAVNRLELIATTELVPIFERARGDLIADIVERSVNRTLPTVIRDASEKLAAAAGNISAASQSASAAAASFQAASAKLADDLKQLGADRSAFNDSVGKIAAGLDNLKTLDDEIVATLDVTASTSNALISTLRAHDKDSLIGLQQLKDAVSHTQNALDARLRESDERGRANAHSLQESARSMSVAVRALEERIATMPTPAIRPSFLEAVRRWWS